MLMREEAFNLVKRHISKRNILYHVLAVEAIMRSVAQHLGEDEEKWGLVGLLHDIDYEKTEATPEKHSLIAKELLKGAVPEELIKAIKSHNFKHTGVKPENRMEKALIACDTTGSQPAESAIKAGADIINDVSGLKNDEKMAKVVAEYDVPLIIVACEKRRERGNPMERVTAAIKESLLLAQKAEISMEKVVVDHGIGFFRHTEWPWYVWDCNVIGNLQKLRVLERPIHIGISRKSFIGRILNQEKPEQRLYGSLSVTAIAVFNGVHMIRTHDVAPTLEVG